MIEINYITPVLGPSREDDDGAGTERGVATKTRPKTKKPSQYKVILMNDDYTPMEFVVSILMGVFKRSQEEATKIMMAVHQKGIGVCGIYTFEVAETKVGQVMDAAKRNQHPLKCTLEKA
ncbi:MAG: ATP-dependent Clp protease adapter ClpS [Robiginitomaculum sp.]|nr:ATP-dependent Clp protease adapter ClpS [Robiginitomaculum sp.]